MFYRLGLTLRVYVLCMLHVYMHMHMSHAHVHVHVHVHVRFTCDLCDASRLFCMGLHVSAYAKVIGPLLPGGGAKLRTPPLEGVNSFC